MRRAPADLLRPARARRDRTSGGVPSKSPKPSSETDHGLNLFLDVAPTNSAAVDVQDEGLAADLSFSGHAFRVWVPWIAVQLLVDLATGAETAFPEHAPPPELPADLATDPWSMCSFCGMDPRDRAVVVGGVEARICDVCVAAAAEVVAAQRASSAPDRET